MNRKVLFAAVLIAILSVSGAFAFGIGVQFDGGPSSAGLGYGPSVTFKLDELPVVFAANLGIRDNTVSLGLTGDWWMFDKQIDSSLPVKWFFGYGFYGHLGFGNDLNLSLGGRLPIGLNAFFADGFVEPYLQVAPSIGIVLSPSVEFPDWSIPVSVGVRFWFD